MAYTPSTEFKYLYVNVKKLLQEAIEAETRVSGRRQVRVVSGDPIDAASLPCIGINRTNLSEDGNSNGLGRVTRSPSYDADTKEYTTYSGAYMQESIEVRIFHTNPDERDDLGIFALAVMYSLRDQLEKQGVGNVTLSGGRDEQDNTLLGDRVLYMHSLSMNYINPLDVTVTTLVDSIESIDVTPDANT